MERLPPNGPNAEQIRYWNEVAGPKWLALQETIDAQIRPLGELAMERGTIAAGDHVLDVGCGCGDTTRTIARRVAPGGAVLGVDLSAPMLDRARQVAAEQGLSNVAFEQADAQAHPFPAASFDAVYSRFGVMFFADPRAAFANLCRALRPGGRLAFVCWQELRENPWMLVPLGAALKHLPAPEPPAPGAPGPFGFADPVRVRGILEGGGFADVQFESVRETLAVGGHQDLDTTVDFLLQMGPLGRLLRESDPALRSVVADSVREALGPFLTADGVRMPSAAWIVTARRGGV